MNKEDKELLIKDLCIRLPYGVLCTDESRGISIVTEIDLNLGRVYFYDFEEYINIKECRPYLRPLSSMTEEEKDDLLAIVKKESDIICDQLKINDCGIKEGKYHFNSVLELEFLLSHHFDYRGLINKGLALEAPSNMHNLHGE